MKILCTTDTHFGFTDKTHNKHIKFFKKISNTEFDIFLHCGDIASHKTNQFSRSLEMMSEYIEQPKLAVCGNHDWWCRSDNMPSIKDSTSSGKYTIRELDEFHKENFANNGFHYLQESPYITDEIDIYGFDGWYKSLSPPTNDYHWMPTGFEHKNFNDRSYKSLEKIIRQREGSTKKAVIATHFDMIVDRGFDEHAGNSNYIEIIRQYFDVMFVGHSHQEREIHLNGLKIYNAGSDYDNPKYIIVDV